MLNTGDDNSDDDFESISKANHAKIFEKMEKVSVRMKLKQFICRSCHSFVVFSFASFINLKLFGK